jgi:hypothetical protein
MKDFFMNKSSFILLLALTVFISKSQAQLLKSYGVKAAVTSSSQSYTYSNPPFPSFGPDVKRRVGFGIALYAEWLNVPVISIISQMEYVQRGIGEEITITTNSPTPIRTEIRDKRLDYLSIPILAKALIPFGIVSPYILVGPRFDILLGYRDEFIVGTSIYQDFKKTMFGGTIGAGFDLTDLLPAKISVEFRYNGDLSDSYDTSLMKVRNSAYDIWVGVAF